MLDLSQFANDVLANSGSEVSPTSYANGVGSGGAGVSGVGSAVGAISGVYGAWQKGQSVKTAAKYNSVIAQAQASMIESQAILQDAFADLEIRNYRKKADSLVATQGAIFAKSGVSLSSGSPALVMSKTIANTEQDVMIMEMNKRINHINTGLALFQKDQEVRAYKSQGKVAQLQAGSEMAQSVGNSAMSYALKYGK